MDDKESVSSLRSSHTGSLHKALLSASKLRYRNMPVFQRTNKLKEAIQEAAKDFTLFPRVCEAFEKHANGAQTAFDATLCPIMTKYQHKHSPASSPSITHPSTTHPSTTHTLANKPYTALLCVLHAIVVSFPRKMSLVLNTKSNASRVLKLVLCPHVPHDLRLCVVTMVGRWCVLVQSQELLPCIVDMAYQRTGQVPQLEFLPKVPIGLQVQNETDPTHTAYFYMPKDVCELAEIDTNGTSVAEDFCTSAPHSDKSDPTLLDLHSMHTCALELHALGTRLTNTLRTMRADKDPQLDPTIQDTTGQLNAAYTQLLDHSRTLNTVYTQTNNVLQVAADEATKSLAFYNTAIQCHKDWVGSRNVGFEGQAGGSNYARAWQPNEPVTIKAGLERVSTKARGKMAAE